MRTHTYWMVPASCFAKNMNKSHRMCQKCWWDPKKGFALETSSHKCRGCQKNMPLNQSTLIPSIIDGFGLRVVGFYSTTKSKSITFHGTVMGAAAGSFPSILSATRG